MGQVGGVLCEICRVVLGVCAIRTVCRIREAAVWCFEPGNRKNNAILNNQL